MGSSKALGKRTAVFVGAFCLAASLVVNVSAAAPAVSASLGQAQTAAPLHGAATPGQGGSQWGTGTLSAADLHALVSQMTLSEEVGMVHGEGDPPSSAAANASCAASAVGCVGEAGWIPGVARLGIPPLRMTDGPAGVRLRHVETAMPAPVGPGRDLRPRRGAKLYGHDGRPGRARDRSGRLARPHDQPGQLPDRRPQLRDARRGPVPGRPAGGRRRCGACRAGHDRRAQALHRERLRERPHVHQRRPSTTRRCTRPSCRRSRPASTAGAGSVDVLLQPHQRRLRLRQRRHPADQSCASSSASPASCSPTGARCTRPPTCIYGTDIEQPGNAAGTTTSAPRWPTR